MSGISTHILDIGLGKPAAGVRIHLERWTESSWEMIADCVTDSDGRCREVLSDAQVIPATYRFTFATGPYFAAGGRTTLYPEVIVSFTVTESGANYHIPLLLSPFGYSTYRGS